MTMTQAELNQLADAIACRVIERLGTVSVMPANDVYIDSHQVAELFGCSKPTVERRTSTGEIPSVKLGRLRRYRRSEVLAMSAQNNEKGP